MWGPYKGEVKILIFHVIHSLLALYLIWMLDLIQAPRVASCSQSRILKDTYRLLYRARSLQQLFSPPSSSEQEIRLDPKAQTLMGNKGNFPRADILNLGTISVVWTKMFLSLQNS